ncbi:MAG TPA: T9SS type A sorting domain-containing protein, partial [Bacteroidetes bacterium]|nr:T9SS type A sorting domain-containing protein [Bacteroidota bacterium]HEX04612.1 T9SS type A sorting domain-containing protein [Bacteroidota bacterium]
IDSSYDIGTWYGYSLRDWTEGPVTLTLTGTTTTVPSTGGDVVYDVSVVSTIGLALQGLGYETYVTLPNSQVFGPLMSLNWNLVPFMNVTVVGMSQYIPDYAPEGDYYFEGRAGFLNIPAYTLTDGFPFTKIGAAADGEIVFNPEDWVASGSFITGDNADVVEMPTQFEMQTAYPNPFNPTTSVAIVLPSASDLTVSVFNVMGQQVATLANGRYNAGQHSFVFNAANLSSGLYFIQAQVPGELNAIQKVTLMK